MQTKVFRLAPDSEAHIAASALLVWEEMEATNNPIPYIGRNLAEVAKDWDNFRARLIAEIQKESPHYLKVTGLLSSSIQVTTYADAYPRAYEHYPTLYVGNAVYPPIYMYSPVDYKGNYFCPEKSTEIKGAALDRLEEELFAGGWSDPRTILSRKHKGVAVPADFKLGKSLSQKGSHDSDRTKICFVAQGESLDTLIDYLNRKDKWTHACDELVCAVKQITDLNCRKDILSLLPKGEDFYSSVSYSYGGHLGNKTQFSLSIRQEGNFDLMAKGRPVKIPDNQFFKLEYTPTGDGVLTPNISTPHGRELEEHFLNVPPLPALSEYQNLHGNFELTKDKYDKALGVTGIVPQHRVLDGVHLLVYAGDLYQITTFCPPDAVPMDTYMFAWLEANEQDRRLNIVPPPPPVPLSIKMQTENTAFHHFPSP